MAEKISATKAKQGRRGIQVLYVLVVGLALAVLVWVGLEFYGEAIDTGSNDSPGAVETNPAPSPQPDTAAPSPGTAP